MDNIKIYKDQFINGKFKVMKNIKNEFNGKYQLITIYKPEQRYFYLKKINLNIYFDSNQLNVQIKKDYKNMNKILFYITNSSDNIITIIFDYYPSLYSLMVLQKHNIFNTEKKIWFLIEDMINVFIIMEKNKEHLKILNFHNILFKEGKEFCIINPYLQENYLNNNKENNNKINKNLFEFGILILNIINRDYHNIRINNSNIIEQLEKIKKKISKKLFELLWIILSKDNLFLFSDIKEYLINGYNFPRFKNILIKYYKTNNVNKINNANNIKVKRNTKSNYSNNSKKTDITVKNSLYNKVVDIKHNNSKKSKSKNLNTKKNMSSYIIKTKSHEYNNYKIKSKKLLVDENLKNNKKIKSLSLREIEELKKSMSINYSDNSIILEKKCRKKVIEKSNNIIYISIITDEGNNLKKKILYRVENNYNKSKNEGLYSNISNVVNWKSILRESLYH